MIIPRFDKDARHVLEEINERKPYAKKGNPIKCEFSSLESDEAMVFYKLQEWGAIRKFCRTDGTWGGLSGPKTIDIDETEIIQPKFDELCIKYGAVITKFPNRKFDKDLWYVLRKIKEREPYTRKGESIAYNVRASSDSRVDARLSPFYEVAVLEKLQEEGNIIIVCPYPPAIKIKIVQPGFDRVYKKHKKNADKFEQKLKSEDIVSVKETKSKATSTPHFNLPSGAMWEKVEIRFDSEDRIKVVYDKKRARKYDAVTLGFVKSGTKDKQPDMQWTLLMTLSFMYVTKTNPTIDQLIQVFKKRASHKHYTKENIQQIKSKLSKRLQELSGIAEDPFCDYDEDRGYRPKFKLIPQPILRGSGELFRTKKKKGYSEEIGDSGTDIEQKEES
jgi:hypothetical protein